MRLRYSDKVNIQLKIPSTIPDQKVPPLLFTSLLENAFKHGISYKKDSFINITLSFSARQLIFMIENSNHARHNKEEGSGIGIKNTRKRLDLMYKENYKLDIVDLEDIYRATLTVPL
jgi:LytS/YehU family sensor histidine kinase